MARVNLPELARLEGEVRTKSVGGAHQQGESVIGPGTTVSFRSSQLVRVSYHVTSVKVA